MHLITLKGCPVISLHGRCRKTYTGNSSEPLKRMGKTQLTDAIRSLKLQGVIPFPLSLACHLNFKRQKSSHFCEKKKKYPIKNKLQWNLDIMKCQGTGKMCSPQRGFVVSRLFFISFTITEKTKIVRYINVRYIEVQL